MPWATAASDASQGAVAIAWGQTPCGADHDLCGCVAARWPDTVGVVIVSPLSTRRRLEPDVEMALALGSGHWAGGCLIWIGPADGSRSQAFADTIASVRYRLTISESNRIVRGIASH